MNLFENSKLFRENVGDFILTFSTVEFQIGELANVISHGVESEKLDPNVMGLDLFKKLKIIRIKVKEKKEISEKWKRLEGKLSGCNDFRRFLSHGIVSNHVPNPHLTGFIRSKRNGVVGFRFRKITNSDLYNQIENIREVHTGRNGLGVLIPEIKNWLKDSKT